MDDSWLLKKKQGKFWDPKIIWVFTRWDSETRRIYTHKRRRCDPRPQWSRGGPSPTRQPGSTGLEAQLKSRRSRTTLRLSRGRVLLWHGSRTTLKMRRNARNPVFHNIKTTGTDVIRSQPIPGQSEVSWARRQQVPTVEEVAWRAHGAKLPFFPRKWISRDRRKDPDTE